jgi:hypothetical protein
MGGASEDGLLRACRPRPLLSDVMRPPRGRVRSLPIGSGRPEQILKIDRNLNDVASWAAG